MENQVITMLTDIQGRLVVLEEIQETLVQQEENFDQLFRDMDWLELKMDGSSQQISRLNQKMDKSGESENGSVTLQMSNDVLQRLSKAERDLAYIRAAHGM